MEYYEAKVFIKINKDTQKDRMHEAISNYINFSILGDSRLSRVHKLNCFKYYTFSLPSPIEKEGVYKEGRIYSFNIRSISSELVIRMAHTLARGCDSFSLEGSTYKCYRFKAIDSLVSLTPIIITKQDGRYLAPEDSDSIVSSITNNIARKYKAYYGSENETNFIESFSIKNSRLIQIPYKNTVLMGNKLEIKVKEDKESQEMALFAAAVGLGEKNSLGAGYCKVVYREEV